MTAKRDDDLKIRLSFLTIVRLHGLLLAGSEAGLPIKRTPWFRLNMSGFDDIWATAPNLQDFPWLRPVPLPFCQDLALPAVDPTIATGGQGRS